MDINNLPVQSGRLKLSDVSPDFANLEGECADEQRAYVVVKVAGTADNQRRDRVIRPKEVRYLNRADDSLVISEITRSTMQERAAIDVFLTLVECGHLLLGAKEVFETLPVIAMDYDDFERIWLGLPLDVSLAIYLAVLSVNPFWVE